MKIRHGLLAIGIAALLVSCTVGPKYAKPTVPMAPAYSEQPPRQYEESQGWRTAAPSDAMLKGKWWEIFDENELNLLEEQVGPANQTLKIAEANYRQARANIQFQRSFRFPTVSVGASISDNKLSANIPTGLKGLQYGSFTLPISASYDADLWGRIRKSVEAAREQTQASAADLENVKLELQTELASYYFTIRGLDSQKRLLDDTVVAYQKAFDLTNNRYQGGVAAKVEVAQAKTQLNQTQAQEIDLGVQRAQLEHAIAVLTGRPPEGFHVAVAELKNTLPVIPVGVPSQLLERRPDIAASERQVAAANEQIGIAKAAKVEVSQAKTQLNQTQAQEIDLGVQRAQLEHAIAVLTGRPPEGFHVAVAELKNTLPVIPVGVPSQLLERRPDIAASERQMAAANEQIGIAKAAFYPDLVIAAEGGLQAGSFVNWFTWPSRFWSIGPQLVAQTIFDAGRRRSQVEISQAAYDATVASYRQTSLTAFQEVEDNLSNLRILEQEIAKQHEATQAAENSQELAMNRYKGGLVTYLEVITAQSIALSNERTEVDLMQRRMDASVQLVRALGGGWDTSKLPKA